MLDIHDPKLHHDCFMTKAQTKSYQDIIRTCYAFRESEIKLEKKRLR